jgi:hypothetical protein
MGITFFIGIRTEAEASDRYRHLAMQWHPDRCTDPDAHEVMAAINDEYAACLAGLATGQWPPTTTADVVEPPPPKPKKAKPNSEIATRRPRKEPIVPSSDATRIMSAAEALGRDIASTAVGVAFGILKRKWHT